MKKYILIPIIFLLLNCSQTTSNSSSQLEQEVDTIYSSDCYGTPTFKQTIMRLGDTTELGNVEFVIGRPSFLKVSMDRFEEYPIWIDSSANISIGKSDSIKGIFEITPLDSSFFIQFRQDYDSGKVVVKYGCDSSNFSVFPVSGDHFAGSRLFKVENISD